MLQPSLPLLDLREPKRPTDIASRMQYAAIYPTLAERQRFVLDLLQDYRMHMRRWGTMAEVTEWAEQQGRIRRNDCNMIRPRASELLKLGLIHKQRLRYCRVTGAKAHPMRVRTR